MITQLSELHSPSKFLNEKLHINLPSDKSTKMSGRRLSYGGVVELFPPRLESEQPKSIITKNEEWTVDKQSDPSYVGVIQLFSDELPSKNIFPSTSGQDLKSDNLLHTQKEQSKTEVSFERMNELFVNTGGINTILGNSIQSPNDTTPMVSPAEKSTLFLQKTNNNESQQVTDKPANAKSEEKAHMRGPSFGLRDMFRTQYSEDEDDEDDTHQLQAHQKRITLLSVLIMNWEMVGTVDDLVI